MYNKKEYTNKKCLPVWLYLEITNTCLVAGDFFVKHEVVRHVPRTSFLNSCQKF